MYLDKRNHIIGHRNLQAIKTSERAFTEDAENAAGKEQDVVNNFQVWNED